MEKPDLINRISKIEKLAKIGHWELDLLENVLFWSDELFRIAELDPHEVEQSYEGFLKIVHPEDRQKVDQAYRSSLETGKSYRIVHRLIMKDGRVKYVEEQCETDFDKNRKPLISRGTMQDITERVEHEKKDLEMQEKILLSAKLASIGELAAGVGHEINNPLQILLGSMQMCKAHLEKEGTLNDFMGKQLEIQQNAIKRMATIVDTLRVYSRVDNVDLELLAVQSCISKSVDMLATLYKKEGVEVNVSLGSEECFILGSTGKFQQVIVNLLNNAKDATLDKKERRIEIRISHTKKEVTIEVEDNGCGIPVHLHSKIFNLFFTTKEVGKGTGLGLSIVARLVGELNGTIGFVSEENKGTTFLLKFPVVEATPETIEPSNVTTALVKDQFLRILLVEDENDLREIYSALLGSQNIQVITADCGESALKILETDLAFDVLITDLSMPGMSGFDFLSEVKRRHSQFKAKLVVMSGQTNTLEHNMKQIDLFVSKPVKIEELIAQILNFKK